MDRAAVFCRFHLVRKRKINAKEAGVGPYFKNGVNKKICQIGVIARRGCSIMGHLEYARTDKLARAVLMSTQQNRKEKRTL